MFRGTLTSFRELSARAGEAFRIGWERDVDAPVSVDQVAEAAHSLVFCDGARFALRPTATMSGSILMNGVRVPLATVPREADGTVSLLPGMAAELECGEQHFHLRYGLSSSVVLPRRFFDWRWSEQKYLAGAAGAIVLFLAMCLSVPPDPAALSLDLLNRMVRVADFKISAPIEEDPMIEIIQKRDTGKAAKGESGKTGDPKAPVRDRRLAIKGNNNTTMFSREQAIDKIRSSALLTVLSGPRTGSALSHILGADTALGSDAEDALGNLSRGPIGSAFGTGGVGVVGTGTGGGGTGESVIGIGGIGTCTDGICGGGPGRNPPSTRLHDRQAKVPVVLPGTGGVTRGSLDKELVRRTIRRHLNEVKYCYEQELTRHAGMNGRVTVQFTIGNNGVVMSSALAGSTLGNSRVESCIVQAVKRWEFPKPEAGGITIVSYPFMLSPAAGS